MSHLTPISLFSFKLRLEVWPNPSWNVQHWLPTPPTCL